MQSQAWKQGQGECEQAALQGNGE